MPWVIRKQASKYKVYKEGPDGEPTGDALGTHDTEDEAREQQRALYASESGKSALKFAEGSDTEIVGLLAPYGGPFGRGKDVAGEFFSVKTDFVLDWFAPDARPVVYHHGLDPKTGPSVVGRIKALSRDEMGLWMRAQLDASHDYYQAIKELIAAGKLGLSSGSMRHLVQTDRKSGEILRWPLIEGSLTPTPCNPAAEVSFAAVKAHFDEIGEALPDNVLPPDAAKMGMAMMHQMMAQMAKDMEMDMSESEMQAMMAGMDKDMPEPQMRVAMRKKMQARKDKDEGDDEHAHKALAVGDDTAGGYLADADEKPRKVVAKEPTPTALTAKMAPDDMRKMMREMSAEMGLKLSDDEMTAMMAGMDTDMPEPEMRDKMRKRMQAHKEKAGKSAEPEVVAAPRQTEPAAKSELTHVLAELCDAVLSGDADSTLAFKALPLTTHAETTAKYALALAERTRDLRERRIKEGRIISMANRKRLSDCLGSMRQACDDLQTLLDSTDKPEAKATNWSDWRHWLEIQKTYLA